MAPIQRVPNACPANIGLYRQIVLTNSWFALAMRGVFVNFVALLTRNAVAKRCVFVVLYTSFIYDTLYFRLKLAGSSHVLTKFMDAQRRTAQFCVTQGVGCASCMCDRGITFIRRINHQRILTHAQRITTHWPKFFIFVRWTCVMVCVTEPLNRHRVEVSC